ncbi:MAG: acetylornithine transaminase [Propionibacteriales bacterium]|nr:acetylornithine transaminase [Propionibacteriales bacterium]
MSEPTWQERYGAALMNTFGTPRALLTRGDGCYVWDAEDRRYLDLLGGIAVNVLGHGHPAVVQAVHRQLSTLGHTSNFFASAPQIELAERLVSLIGAGEGRVFFTNSGTEANEAALKLTRRTGRTRLIAATGGFHGRTMGALALTHKAAYREPFEPLPGQVEFVEYGDADALAAAVDSTTAAVVLEPVQGEAGVVVPAAGYLEEARELATAHGALLWLDEIQSGMGRTGHWFAHQAGRVRPDVVTVAKGLGGGLPIGACVALGDAAGLLGPGQHGTTFGGNPVAAAAALAVLDTIEADDLLAHAAKVGDHLVSGMRSAHPAIAEVRGRGLLIGVRLTEPVAARVAASAMEHGFVVNDCTPDTVRLAPALILTTEQADTWLAALPAILDQVAT